MFGPVVHRDSSLASTCAQSDDKGLLGVSVGMARRVVAAVDGILERSMCPRAAFPLVRTGLRYRLCADFDGGGPALGFIDTTLEVFVSPVALARGRRPPPMPRLTFGLAFSLGRLVFLFKGVCVSVCSGSASRRYSEPLFLGPSSRNRLRCRPRRPGARLFQ